MKIGADRQDATVMSEADEQQEPDTNEATLNEAVQPDQAAPAEVPAAQTRKMSSRVTSRLYVFSGNSRAFDHSWHEAYGPPYLSHICVTVYLQHVISTCCWRCASTLCRLFYWHAMEEINYDVNMLTVNVSIVSAEEAAG